MDRSEERREIMGAHRGFFPRAVCRLELAMRNWETGDGEV